MKALFRTIATALAAVAVMLMAACGAFAYEGDPGRLSDGERAAVNNKADEVTKAILDAGYTPMILVRAQNAQLEFFSCPSGTKTCLHDMAHPRVVRMATGDSAGADVEDMQFDDEVLFDGFGWGKQVGDTLDSYSCRTDSAISRKHVTAAALRALPATVTAHPASNQEFKVDLDEVIFSCLRHSILAHIN